MTYWGAILLPPSLLLLPRAEFVCAGYKFEEISTLPGNPSDFSSEVIESRDHNVVNNEEQFCSIVKTGFGNVRLIIGGEVDAGLLPPVSTIGL